MLGFLITEAMSALTPGYSATLPSTTTSTQLMAATVAPITTTAAVASVSAPANVARAPLESYCLWPNDTLYDIARYADVDVNSLEKLNEDNSGHAGSTIYLPPNSRPPAQWNHPLPAITSLDQLPFGVSGIYLGYDNRQKRVALTFDVGYVPENKALMEMLKAKGIRATFFVVGFSVLRHPEMITDILENGHELANHSWSHENLQGMSADDLLYELGRTEETVQKAYPGATTKPYFRAPFGAITPAMVAVAQQAGYAIIGWTVDSRDWVEGVTGADVYKRVTRLVCPGAIVVMHDVNPANGAALPGILDFLVNSGYQFVPLSELLLPS